jgi:WD40 repeat protein
MVSCKKKCSVPLFPSLLLAALVGLSVAGCVYIPPIGRQIGDEDLGKIVVGATTRTEVLDLLGQPQIHAGRFIVDETFASSGTLVALPPFWINYERIFVPLKARAYRVLLRFDDRDIVDRFEAEGFDGNRALLGAAQPSQVAAPEYTAGPRRTLFRSEASFWSSATGFSSVTFSPDGKSIAASDAVMNSLTVSESGRVWIENLETGHRTRLEFGPVIGSVAFSPDGTKLAALARTARILEAATGKHVASFGGHGDEIFWRFRGAAALAFAPDGKTVATGGGVGEVKLWDAETAAERLSFQAHEGWVFSVAFSPDGSLLATSDADDSVRLWDPATGTELVRIPRPGHLAFSPNGRRLAVATPGHVEMWRVVTRGGAGQGHPEPVVEGPVEMFILPVVTLLRGRRPSFRALSVAFSPDSRLIAACAGGASIWDLETSQQIWRIVPGGESTLNQPFGSGRIYDCAFTPDGKSLATAGDDGVHLWDLTGLVPESTHIPRSISSADPTRRNPVSP